MTSSFWVQTENVERGEQLAVAFLLSDNIRVLSLRVITLYNSS